MRIIQLIDSLHVGGAERMAVNYANALQTKIEFSGLVTTRAEGELKGHISQSAGYLYLNKKSAIDGRAILRLRRYCADNKVGFIHAHGTSFFTAFLLKMVYPKIKIVWHEHKGARSGERLRQNPFLWICSKFFSGIIVVDHNLETWCRSKLNAKQVVYFPNFTLFGDPEKAVTQLNGEEGKRILCLANLRHPKNHHLLVEVAARIKSVLQDWTFHFIGNDLQDSYSKTLKQAINENSLEGTVYIYGLREDTAAIIAQSEICVLSSLSEGLPVALLEYGMHGKAVLATAVGEIPLIIENGKNGLTVPSGDAAQFAKALETLIKDPELRRNLGEALRHTIQQTHSEEAIIGNYLDWLKKI